MSYYPLDRNPSGMIFVGDAGVNAVLATDTSFVYDSGQGFLGINVAQPLYELDVSGTGSFREIRFADGSTQTSAYSWTITDGVNSEGVADNETIKFTGAGATAVSYNTSTNTVTINTAAGATYTAGTGLTLNGNTFDANVEPTTQSEAAQPVTSTVNKTYAIQVDGSDYMVVNVPWTDTNTTYTAGSGIVLNGTTFDANVNATKQTTAAQPVTSTASRTYAIQVDTTTDDLVVNVPWTDNDTTYTAGSGLVLNGTTIDAQVDNSTIEINSDTFRVKDGGITNAKLANSSITLTADGGSNETVSLGDTLDIAGGSGISTTVGATDTVTVNLTVTAVTAGSYGDPSLGSGVTFTVDANGRLTAAANEAITITSAGVSDFTSAAETAIFTDANFVDGSTIDFTVSAGASVTAEVKDSSITEAKRVRTTDHAFTNSELITADLNLVNVQSASVSIRCPSPSTNSGRIIYVKKVDPSANTVTIQKNGAEFIDSGNQYILYNQFESVVLACDGTNWHVF